MELVSFRDRILPTLILYLTLVLLTIAILSLILTYVPSFSQEVKFVYPFENKTHIQFATDGGILLKPDIYLSLPLVKDNDGYGFSGEPYKPATPTVELQINYHGKLRTYDFNLTNSGSQQVSISDTQIYPSFTFKMPLGPNSTT